jgi:glycosyltransferase involved in cell wall biosynthesis
MATEEGPVTQSAVNDAAVLGALPAISRPYLLVLFGVPLYIDDQGRRYVDPLWAKDLLEHLRYLERLTLCSLRAPLPGDRSALVCLDDDPRYANLRSVGLPRPGGLLSALLLAPRTAWLLWRELGKCALVHSSVAGWPLAEAWFLTPMLCLRPRPHLIIVESAFWRLPLADPQARWSRKLWSRLQEWLARACLRRADLAIFTHEGYRASLLDDPQRGHVIEASWLDQDIIIDVQQLAEHQDRRRSDRRLKLAYFGRLTEAKGVLDAVRVCRDLHQSGMQLSLDVYGEGPLQRQLLEAAGTGNGVQLLEPLPYGPAFFDRVGSYDAVVVPTHSDEQPRIVFDAYSQGVPVLASDTPGHRQCVQSSVTGRLFEPANLQAMSTAIQAVAQDRSAWMSLATACRRQALLHTHRAMHDRRRRLMLSLF